MKLNEQTKRFLLKYKPVMAKAGIKDDKQLCLDVLKYAPSQLAQVRMGNRNMPDHLLYKFCKYFKLDESIIFGEPSGKQTGSVIEFSDGTKKKIVSKVEVDKMTILILK